MIKMVRNIFAPDMSVEKVFSDLGLATLNPSTLWDRMVGFSIPQPNLMRNYRKEDGTNVYEYNLAGFGEDEIRIQIDTALNELIVAAEHNEEGNNRKVATVLTLSPYTSPEDIQTRYLNGVLSIEVAPLEKRKQESLVTIPLKKELASNAASKTETSAENS